MGKRPCWDVVGLSDEVLRIIGSTPTGVPPAGPDELRETLLCPLLAGHVGRHHARARVLPMLKEPGGVWVRWDSLQPPSEVLIASDCGAPDPDNPQVHCLLFYGHAGPHRCETGSDETGQSPQPGLVPRQPGDVR